MSLRERNLRCGEGWLSRKAVCAPMRDAAFIDCENMPLAPVDVLPSMEGLKKRGKGPPCKCNRKGAPLLHGRLRRLEQKIPQQLPDAVVLRDDLFQRGEQA